MHQCLPSQAMCAVGHCGLLTSIIQVCQSTSLRYSALPVGPAWPAYCLAATCCLTGQLGGCPVCLLLHTLLLSYFASQGLPGLCDALLLHICCFTGQSGVACSVCCCFAAVPLCHWKPVRWYAASLICDVTSQGLLDPCAALSLESLLVGAVQPVCCFVTILHYRCCPVPHS